MKKLTGLSLMYGISFSDISFCSKKIANQFNYLNSHFFVGVGGNIKSYLDVTMSSYFSSKYYAEVVNRINTFNYLSIDDGLVPVFITITLNGCFRDALKGDFSRFSPKDRYSLPYELKFKFTNKIPFSIKNLIYVLNYNFSKFTKRFRSKFKYSNMRYIRCFEPHKKDGVPHIHALVYVEKNLVDDLKDIYKSIFYAPQNLRTDKLKFEQIKNKELNGFQTSINNATGYICKYITKTFMNVDENSPLDELKTWYIKHNVRRFISSKMPIPMWVFRKIKFLTNFRDFHLLCIKKNLDNFEISYDYKENYIELIDHLNGDHLIFVNKSLKYYKFNSLIYERVFSYDDDIIIKSNSTSMKYPQSITFEYEDDIK